MKIPRIVLAGATSGVGKTSITCSIIYALQKRGFSVQPFKVGPDYIDPSYLTTISKNDTYNLDVWLMGQKQVLDSFVSHSNSDISIIEGVMGYYDDNGNFILVQENLGNEGTVFLPYVVSYPWDLGEANLFDADYIKLREISINYRLPNNISQSIGMQDVNFSVYSRNILIWTKDAKLGVDPERAYQAEGSGRFSQGVERFNAEPWVVPVGFKVGFTF